MVFVDWVMAFISRGGYRSDFLKEAKKKPTRLNARKASHLVGLLRNPPPNKNWAAFYLVVRRLLILYLLHHNASHQLSGRLTR